jgi:hypothetical protein
MVYGAAPMRPRVLLVPLVLVLLGCTANSPPAPNPSQCSAAVALVAMSDYTSADLASIQLDGGGWFTPSPWLGTDPALAVSRGRAFALGRLVGTIASVDPCGALGPEINVNDPAKRGTSNPQDVAVAPDGALWVPRYNVPSIAIVRGTAVASTIDLSRYDDDGNPNAAALRIVDVGGAAKAFVPLEKLTLSGANLVPHGPSTMLRIDVATETIEAEIELVGKNPFNAPGAIAERGALLYLAEPGTFTAADEDLAGIERFDTATSSSSLLVREKDLGGSAVEVAVTGRCGAVLIADASADNRVALATFDADTGAVLATNVVGQWSADFDTGLRGLGWIEGGTVLLVGDRAPAGALYPIHAFERDDACGLHAREDRIFVRQKPIAVKGSRDS